MILKRVIAIGIMVLFLLTLFGTLTASAEAPGSIIIDIEDGHRYKNRGSTDGVPPPEITIILPDGTIMKLPPSSPVNNP